MTALTDSGAVGAHLPFPPVWLRDNCPCPDCRDPQNGQKLFQVTDLPEDLEVDSVEETGDCLRITFAPDGHRSIFKRAWLSDQCGAAPGDGRTEQDKLLWRAEDLADKLPVTSWSLYRNDDAERLRALRDVARLGFAIVRRAPLLARTVIEVVSTFGYVRETNYGDLFDVRVELAPTNLAFTGLAISPHTDNPYRDPVPTLQLLHCLSNAVAGGESCLVDGFEAAATLRREDRTAFAVLSGTPVPFAWSDASTRLRAVRPLIETDTSGRIRGVRFNNRSMQALRLQPAALAEFYRAHRSFAAIIARPELQLEFRLEVGDCLIFDNTRLLHARSAFSDTGGGARHLQGCYADIDGLLSTIAVLEGALGEQVPEGVWS